MNSANWSSSDVDGDTEDVGIAAAVSDDTDTNNNNDILSFTDEDTKEDAETEVAMELAACELKCQGLDGKIKRQKRTITIKNRDLKTSETRLRAANRLVVRHYFPSCTSISIILPIRD